MSFPEKIIDWFHVNKRDLPWRKTTNPYYIWLSEIILQQTRVNQGMSYYFEFIEKYPTIETLAKADEQDVLKTWQGLGYYSRARNLHATAKIITQKYNGKFPQTYNEILSLKGIGKYTAAAIASFAFKLPCPVVDGNVYRFISRLFGIFTPIASTNAHTEFETILTKLIDISQPDIFNQAIMEFGALHCKPQNPNCTECLFKNECFAFKHSKQKDLPVKKTKIQVKTRYFYYFVLRIQNKFTCIQKRIHKDIWHNLNEFLLLETSEEIPENLLTEKTTGFLVRLGINQFSISTSHKVYKHQLSHQTIIALFIEIETNNVPNNLQQHQTIIPIDKITTYPVSRLVDLYLQHK